MITCTEHGSFQDKTALAAELQRKSHVKSHVPQVTRQTAPYITTHTTNVERHILHGAQKHITLRHLARVPAACSIAPGPRGVGGCGERVGH